MTNMRTRLFPKMTNEEVETYLQRNDIIFVPVGTVEMHGRMPLDVETTIPTAFSLVMAEKVDGLVLSGLPYFFCGATTIGRGTIQMSVGKGTEYLKEICYSLINQGFRRIILVGAHGPAYLTAGNVVIDVFDETKVPITYMDAGRAMSYGLEQAQKQGLVSPGTSAHGAMSYGAYEILHCKDELIVDLNDVPVETEYYREYDENGKMTTQVAQNEAFFIHLRKFGHPSGTVGFYMTEPTDHGGTVGAFRSKEERDEACAQGAELMRIAVDHMGIEQYVQEIRDLDRYTEEVIRPKYGKYLPKNKFAPWK